MLLGVSAGAIGTEANCDMVADTLHAINPDIKVTCIKCRFRTIFKTGCG